MIEGEVEFHTELYAPLTLHAGDSIYFDSEMGHAYLKASDAPVPHDHHLLAARPRRDDEGHLRQRLGQARGRAARSRAGRRPRTRAKPAK